MMHTFWKALKRWSWWSLKSLVVLLAITGIVYQMKFAPIAVVAYPVERGSIVSEVMGTGTLEARVGATISPKIPGRIVEVVVDQGQGVSTGDLLVRLNDEELKQQVSIAQANIGAADAAIVRLTADKIRAVAVYEQARTSHDRTQSLVKKNATSREDADKATEALAVAEAGISRAEAAIAEGQKARVVAERTLAYHRARLQDTEIRAPFDGLIVKRSREPGDIVVPGSSIMTLISTHELWISAWVDETEMSRLERDQSARVVFRSDPSRSFAGTVARLGREADRETREFIVDVNVLELPKNWAVGQRAETFIKVAEADEVLVLPAKLVVKRDGEDGVFVNVNGRAAWRPIALGLRSRDAVQVLDGLSTGDSVVTPVNERAELRDDQSVVTP